jgi:hypothetical protein
LKQLQMHLVEASAHQQSNLSRKTKRSDPVSGRGLAPSRTGAGKPLAVPMEVLRSSAKLPEQSASAQAKGEEEPGSTISAVTSFPQSLSGVVDAILEVGTQRKSLLSQLRSELASGHDSEALGLARRLCGLPA